ncbi:Disease resistance protein, partial [Thalictrum thalictroides]
MEIGGAAVGETAKSIIGHLEREIGYLVHFRRNVDNLKHKFQQLTAEKGVVEQRIRAATDNGEVIRETVNKWLSDVDAVQTYVTQLSDEAGQISSCFRGWFCSRFRLGRKAYKKIPGIQDLLDRRNTFGDTVSDPKPIQSLERVSAYDYEDFASRKSLTKKIINGLVNDNICLVGVFGMPGIGKTKLMEALSKQVKQKNLFDEVVMVTISQNPDVKTIQNNVGKQLDMQLQDNEDMFVRAMHLHDRLKTQDKKILIVLDDLWNELKLEEVGIPRKSECKSYKIVITTRFEQVCSQMKTDLDLNVPVLSTPDSWALFRENVGDVVDTPELEKIARRVVDECAGLPLAIVTLGRALRKKAVVNVWADTLRRLQKSINEDLGRVYSSIKLSYDFLSNEVQKRCFLFCSLFPEDYEINVKEELLVYVVGENLLEDGEDCFNSLEETKGRLDSIVEDLISSSLLLRSRNGRHIMMHDVVRDVAKMIAYRDEEFKQKADAVQTDLMKWPEHLENCKRLSLMRTKIKCNLPGQVEAQQLLSLFLNSCKGFIELPCDFFVKMKKLKNLDLSDTEIVSLPSSISCLVELVTLRLRLCSSLKNICPIERLEKLEILDLCESGIERLPEEMGKLTNLKSLNLSDMKDLESISPKVISSMCQLEELYAGRFKGWEIGGNANLSYSNFISEVASLAKLTCLEIRMPNVECFSTNTSINW